MVAIKNKIDSQHFEARHIKKLFGIDRNKLFYWSKTHGLLRPEIEEPEGTGNRAKFSAKNLVEIALIQEMLKYGFDLRTVQLIKAELDTPREEFKGSSLIDYSLETHHPYQYSVSILSIRQGRVSCFVTYFDQQKAGASDENLAEFPGSNATFFINREPDPSMLSRFISVKIQLGQLAHDILSRIGEP